MRDYRELRDLRDIVPLETDLSLIGQGYRLPVLAVRVDLLDLLFIVFNLVVLLLIILYVVWRRMSAIRLKHIDVEVHHGLQVPFFSISRGTRKNKLKEQKEHML
jgi:hypothetical protein